MLYSKIFYPKQLSLALLAILLLNCQSAQKSVVESNVNPNPKWILQPPEDNGAYLYGIGNGDDRKSAIRSALADIASKISIEVSAEFNNKLSVNKREFELIKTDSSKTVNAKSIKIKINNYKVIDIFAPLPTKIYVLLKTNRQQILDNHLNLLNNQLKKYQLDQQRIKKSNKFTQYKFLKRAELDLTKFVKNILIINNLNPKINTDKYLNHEQTIRNDLDTLISDFKFTVSADDQNSVNFVTAIKGELAKQQLLASDNSNFEIKVATSRNISKSHGFTTQKFLIDLTVLEKNQAVDNHKITIKYVGTTQTDAIPNKVITKFIKKLPPILDR